MSITALALVIADLENDLNIIKREGREAHRKGNNLKALRCAQIASALRKTIDKKRIEQQKGPQ